MRARLAGNDGFTTVAIMVTAMLSGLLVIAAFATANNGTPLARADQNSKQAYSAAEAGVAWYAYHLKQDPNYWTYCTNPPKAHPTDPDAPLWDGTAADPRVWRNMESPTAATDLGSPAQFNVTLIPAPGAIKCESGLAPTTFFNQQTGTFTVRSTGMYRGKKRSIVATFKRKGFVDFLWFTDYETPDWQTYPPTDRNAAQNSCIGRYHRNGRPIGTVCADQQFIDGDQMLGPMHTNDRFYTCGLPQFGQTANDAIEASDPDEYQPACGSAEPSGPGTNVPGAPILNFPPTNTQLASDTLTGYTFTGKTELEFLANGTMKVTNAGKTTQMALPTNNVVYVKNGTCTQGYQEAQKYTATGCGDAWVKGVYPRSLTVGADNDIIINGDLTRVDPDTEMGLIANGFVRVYHPIQFSGAECSSSDPEAPGALTNGVTIDAAILSLQHSFMVDNPKCGDGMGNLTVDGAIAQKYRGTVGTHNGSVVITGYLKKYSYDETLHYADPPYFMDPVETQWNVVRETEQVPAS
jgi:hypothetical protein